MITAAAWRLGGWAWAGGRGEAGWARVVDGRGAEPPRLSGVRKAGGAEVPRGGVVWPECSDGDVGMLSWLASKIDADACKRAATALSTPTMFVHS